MVSKDDRSMKCGLTSESTRHAGQTHKHRSMSAPSAAPRPRRIATVSNRPPVPDSARTCSTTSFEKSRRCWLSEVPVIGR